MGVDQALAAALRRALVRPESVASADHGRIVPDHEEVPQPNLRAEQLLAVLGDALEEPLIGIVELGRRHPRTVAWEGERVNGSGGLVVDGPSGNSDNMTRN